MWRGVYVTKFPGFDGQLRLIADWVLDVFLPRDITQLRLFHEEAVHREHFEPRETVFANGDFGDKVYFIIKGEAAVERNGALLATLHSGDVFGEAALIFNQPRNATIRATGPLDTVKSVFREAFLQELLMHLPGLNGTDAGAHEWAAEAWPGSGQHDARSRRLRPRRLPSDKFRKMSGERGAIEDPFLSRLAETVKKFTGEDRTWSALQTRTSLIREPTRFGFPSVEQFGNTSRKRTMNSH